MVDLAEPCWHIKEMHSTSVEFPYVQTFTPYVDEHISMDGKPVLVTDASQKRALLRSQWDGHFLAQLRERDPDQMRRKAALRRERILDTRGKR